MANVEAPSEVFVDIDLVEVNRDGLRKPVGQPPAIWDVPLVLSDTPPDEWKSLFNRAWKQHFYGRRRDAWVEGSDMIVRCDPEELQTHIEELRKMLPDVNRIYRDCLTNREARLSQLSEEEAVERRRVDRALDQLQF